MPITPGAAVNDSQLPEQFQLRPNFRNKFKPSDVQSLIHKVLQERLHGVEYQTEQAAQLTKEISNLVRDKCTDLKYERYKFVVNVVIMENRGEGVKMGCRCFWDEDCDNYASDIFMNVS